MPPFDIAFWREQHNLADFDRLMAAVRSWVEGLPPWEPFEQARALWRRVDPRLSELQVNLDRVLVVGVVGGTGAGKSTLVNAIVGQEVCRAGDVQRPTTTRPVIVHHPDVDPSFLPLSTDQPEIHAVPVKLLENIVLVDCPDPDTQSRDEQQVDETGMSPISPDRNAGANHNLDILRRVLPHCDVLICVGTAQKYKTETVTRELRNHAPGRQVVFVQTHASTDADIRSDWRKHLEAEGFDVPVIFRVDSQQALERREQGQPAPAAFNELLDFLDRQLAERGRERIKRANVLDLIDWYLQTVAEEVQPALPRLDQLEQTIALEQARLFGKVRARLEEQLRDYRHLWRVRLLREVTQRWSGGPFAAFVRVVSGAGSLFRLLPLARVRGLTPLVIAGGVGAGKAVIEHWRESLSSGEWVTSADLGVNLADVAEAQSVLDATARQADFPSATATAEPRESRKTMAQNSLAQLAGQLHRQIEGTLAATTEQRTRRRAGGFFHFLLEILFCALPAVLLGRLAYNFFYEHNWLSIAEPDRPVKPIYGLEYLVQALLWIIVWGLLLRGWLVWRLERGLTRDIRRMIEGLSASSLLEPLFDDVSAQVTLIRSHSAVLDNLRAQTAKLRETLFHKSEGWQLGRLRSAV